LVGVGGGVLVKVGVGVGEGGGVSVAANRATAAERTAELGLRMTELTKKYSAAANTMATSKRGTNSRMV
jgi:hypothetical protein